jgi:hypothetical protein
LTAIGSSVKEEGRGRSAKSGDGVVWRSSATLIKRMFNRSSQRVVGGRLSIDRLRTG